MLLRANADLTLKSERGESVLTMCQSFPELKGVLEKRERKMKLRGTGNRNMTDAVEVLGKRISTATAIQHEMWLISLDNLLMLYGGEKGNRLSLIHISEPTRPY